MTSPRPYGEVLSSDFRSRLFGFFFICLVIICELCSGSCAQQEEINQRFRAIFQPGDCWFAAIAEAKTGRMIYRQRADLPCLPASNLKLFVTTTAFEYLGSHFRYRTPLMGHGSLDGQGVWHGDLLVRGSGDPTFSGRFEANELDATAAMDRWADQLLSRGFREIRGNLYGFDDVFDENYWGAGWPEKSWMDWYTAPSGGLILNDSCLDVGIYPNRPGQPPSLRTVPETNSIPINNVASTTAKRGRNSLNLSRPFLGNDFKLSGQISSGNGPVQVTVAVNDPTKFFIEVLKEVFEKKGIRISGKAMDADLAENLPTRGWHVLAWKESPTLIQLAQVINTRSQNLFADSLLKTLGQRRAGSGSWKGGEKVVKDFLASLKIDNTALQMEDGSGLSRLDRVTAQMTLDLLLAVQKKAWFRDWRQTLAVSGGTEGSLRKRLNTPLLEGKVFAKTGFIDNVYCLSGYVLSQNNRVYAFSFMFNGGSQGGKHPHDRMEEALTLLARDEP